MEENGCVAFGGVRGEGKNTLGRAILHQNISLTEQLALTGAEGVNGISVMETVLKESAPLTVAYPGAAFWAFGDSPQMADELGALVVEGIKTATCCSLQAYQQDASSLRIGDYSVILDGRERPLAVIRTTALRLLRFFDVIADMAAKEGEGDLRPGPLA